MNLLFANTSRFVSHGIVVTSWRLLTLLVSALIFNLSAISVWDLTENKLAYCTTLILVMSIAAVIVYWILKKKAFKETVLSAECLKEYFKSPNCKDGDYRTFVCRLFEGGNGGLSLDGFASCALGFSGKMMDIPKEDGK